MTAAALAAAERATPEPVERGAAYVRASSLLVLARVIAQLADVGALVVLARYLPKSDYGALMYGLALVVLFKAVAVFELPNTLGRFVPIFREEGRDDAAFGGVFVGLAMVAALGLVVAIAVDLAVLTFDVHPTSSLSAASSPQSWGRPVQASRRSSATAFTTAISASSAG